MILRALLAVSDPTVADFIRGVIEGSDIDVLAREVEDTPSVWEALRREPFDVVIADTGSLGEDSARAVEEIRSLPSPPTVLVLADAPGPEARASHLAAGAFALVRADAGEATLGESVRALLARRKEEGLRGLGEAEEGVGRLSDFASQSPSMRRFLATVRKVVSADCTLLLTGETGVGKEYLARAIYAESHRADGPFVAINCAALPEALLESELFGHVEGAFTGALRDRRGHFELAHGGTIFLDEVAEMPLHLQSRLLRVLQEREVQPVGSEEVLNVDVRVIAATNRELRTEIVEKRFRDDLYYRLSVVTLEIPPLRERREDIPSLAESHLEHFRRALKRPVFAIAPEALECLLGYSWPGNVRELSNVIERAVLLTDGETITTDDLPDDIRGVRREDREAVAAAAETADAADYADLPYKEARERILDAFERRYFTAALTESGGRVGESAARAGISERALYEKMKRLGLAKEAFKRPSPAKA